MQDKSTNNYEYTVYKKDEISNKIFKQKTKSQNLKPGDIIEINKNEIVPADLIILKTSDRSGSVFIGTDQLDGETDWKLRIAPVCTQQAESFEDFLYFKGFVEAAPPSRNIYESQGCLNIMGFCSKQVLEVFAASKTKFLKDEGELRREEIGRKRRKSKSREVKVFPMDVVDEKHRKNFYLNKDCENVIEKEVNVKDDCCEREEKIIVEKNVKEALESISNRISDLREEGGLVNKLKGKDEMLKEVMKHDEIKLLKEKLFLGILINKN